MIKWILYLLIIITNSCIVKKLDKSPYQSQTYYKKTFAQINKIKPIAISPLDTFFAGWGKVNITPLNPAPIAGYGGRNNKKFDKILDSIFIKTIVFKNGNNKSAIICADLLIFPMEVRKVIFSKIFQIGYSPNQLYLTATHSHNSLGGWGTRLLGKAIAGPYSKSIVQKLAAAVINSILIAEKKMLPSTVSYEDALTTGLIKNRLIDNNSYLDTTLRVLKITNSMGKQSALVVYAAHPTCIPSSSKHLSGDYPSAFTNQLEKTNEFDMVGFAAGGVASHAPILSNDTSFQERISNYSNSLVKAIKNRLPKKDTTPALHFESYQISLNLRKPQFRISPKLVLAPWLFYSFFGKYESYISVSKIGNILMIGTPCDFSGQLALPLYHLSSQKGLQLIITSFNGGYIGYVTPDQYYELAAYETKDMNLFGPNNGNYLSEIIAGIIQKY